jgi:GT2 family glycosyltransferase
VFELVVVDDASTDGSGERARGHGARVIRHEAPRGPAAARNTGARAATAPIVFFLDADVVPHPGALRRAMVRFDRDPGLSALFGSYDEHPEAPGLVSRYRNLLHHYVHQQGEFTDGARPAHTFWTGCGAIRRQAFLDVGGFDPHLYRRPAIEDIELGYRLARAGHRILLARDIQVTHLKRWTLRSIILTDVFHRGVPWMLLMLRTRTEETDLNVNRGQRACVAATGLGLLGLAASPLAPAALLVFLLNVAVIVLLNGDFYRFLASKRGLAFTAAAFPLHYLYFCCCGVSVMLALAIQFLANARPRAADAPRTVHEGHESTASPSRVASDRVRRASRWIRR